MAEEKIEVEDLLSVGDTVFTRCEEKWEITDIIGRGGYGEVYKAQAGDKMIAIKVENTKRKRQHLILEEEILVALQGNLNYFCRFLGSGSSPGFYFIGMSLVGKSIQQLKQSCTHQIFSLWTSLMVAKQMLGAIKYMHQIGYLHRDIKPSNFSVGLGENAKNIYLYDFGLSRQYKVNGKIKEPRPIVSFQGTMTYAAVNAHNKVELGRQDDLYSLFYIILEFIKGSLPWSHLKEKKKIGPLKSTVNWEEYLNNEDFGPEPVRRQLKKILEHLNGLTYHDEPKYDFIENCFINILTHAVNSNNKYDWEL